MDKKNIVLLTLFVIFMFAPVVVLHHNQQQQEKNQYGSQQKIEGANVVQEPSSPLKVASDNFWSSERIDEKTEKILLQILFSPVETGRDKFGENMMIAEILEKHPNKELVAQTIIDKLYELQGTGELKNYINNIKFESPVYFSTGILKETATPDFAPRIGAMLEWDEIYLDDSRSTRINLVETLEKIGTEEEIKYLLTFAEKVKEVDYDKNFPPKHLIYLARFIEENNTEAPKTENLRQYDQNDVAVAITAIENR